MATGIRHRLVAVGMGAVAAVGLAQTYLLPVEWNCGPSGRYWERARRRSSRLLGSVLDDRAGPRPISRAEYAGSLSMALEDAETLLWRNGFVRNPFARVKTLDGRPEAGSWVYRASPLAERQVHFMLFRTEPGSIALFAHEEPSSVHPLVVATHFDGTDQNVAAGVAFARDALPLDASDASVEPIEGPWSVQPNVVE